MSDLIKKIVAGQTLIVSHEDANLPNLGPDFESAAGMPQFDTDFDVFYNAVIDRLGGVQILAQFLPFDLETLKKSYSIDEHFNTPLTPISAWDQAAGWQKHTGFTQGYRIRRNYNSFQNFLLVHGITSYSPSDTVCLLKRTAARLIEKEAQSHV